MSPLSEHPIHEAAREVIAAADNTYGPRWRHWPASGAANGAKRLARALSELEAVVEPDPPEMKRFWYWAPWKLVNPVWPWFWRGGDEHGRPTAVIQPPLLGAFIFPTGPACPTCAELGECDVHHA